MTSLTAAVVACRTFEPNIFKPNLCRNCGRPMSEHKYGSDVQEDEKNAKDAAATAFSTQTSADPVSSPIMKSSSQLAPTSNINTRDVSANSPLPSSSRDRGMTIAERAAAIAASTNPVSSPIMKSPSQLAPTSNINTRDVSANSPLPSSSRDRGMTIAERAAAIAASTNPVSSPIMKSPSQLAPTSNINTRDVSANSPLPSSSRDRGMTIAERAAAIAASTNPVSSPIMKSPSQLAPTSNINTRDVSANSPLPSSSRDRGMTIAERAAAIAASTNPVSSPIMKSSSQLAPTSNINTRDVSANSPLPSSSRDRGMTIAERAAAIAASTNPVSSPIMKSPSQLAPTSNINTRDVSANSPLPSSSRDRGMTIAERAAAIAASTNPVSSPIMKSPSQLAPTSNINTRDVSANSPLPSPSRDRGMTIAERAAAIAASANFAFSPISSHSNVGLAMPLSPSSSTTPLCINKTPLLHSTTLSDDSLMPSVAQVRKNLTGIQFGLQAPEKHVSFQFESDSNSRPNARNSGLTETDSEVWNEPAPRPRMCSVRRPPAIAFKPPPSVHAHIANVDVILHENGSPKAASLVSDKQHSAKSAGISHSATPIS